MLGLLALFGGYVALEYYRPKPIDWSITLSSKDKIPFGTYALYDVLPTLLGTDSLTNVRQPIYNQFFDEEEPETEGDASSPSETVTTTTVSDDSTTTTTTTEAAPEQEADTTATAAADSVAQDEEYDGFGHYRANYLFVNTDFSATSLETDALRRFVAKGNDVLIAAWNFNQSGRGMRRRRASLLDSLGVTQKSGEDAFSGGKRDSLEVHFVNPALAGSSLRLPLSLNQAYFEVAAGRQGRTLATDARGRAVMVQLDYGRGHFLLCSVPLAFTNYYVLPPRTRRFALAALSYLPTGRPVWWDEYQKQGPVGEQSVLRFFMAHDSLRWAYYLLLLTGTLLVLVEARRRQRVIPTLKPLPNTTLLFTRAVASLYRQGSNHQLIADKKVRLFLDYLRTRFQEPAADLGSPVFRERLSEKAGLPQLRVDELARLINFARTSPVVSDRELLILSRAIRDFKRESG